MRTSQNLAFRALVLKDISASLTMKVKLSLLNFQKRNKHIQNLTRLQPMPFTKGTVEFNNHMTPVGLFFLEPQEIIMIQVSIL